MKRASLFCLVTLVVSPLVGQTVPVSAAELRGLAAAAKQGILALARSDVAKQSAGERRKQFRMALADEAARKPLAAVLDHKLAALERGYASMLDSTIRDAYQRKLMALSAEDLRTVATTRRVWRNYLENPSTQLHFQQHFLQPAAEVGKLLFPDVTKLGTKRSRLQFKCMLEFNAYRDETREALGLGEDPSAGVLAPTGIPMPPVQQVRTYEQHVAHLHRTMAIASSVAPIEARKILWDNAAKARFIDFEEAEFILFANEVRMAMGTIAWATDILACAATRDHSKDRAEGRAKGHTSSVPGKRGFTHRLRRFGTRGTSEGAGGGRNGRGYLRGLSYGGGHTGPLYSAKRNMVGVGRHGNVYTSTYGKDGKAIHNTQLFEGELFMPPGISPFDSSHTGLQAVCAELKIGDYGKAKELLGGVSAKSKLDKFLARYLAIAIQVEADWQLQCLARIDAAGDPFHAQLRITRIREVFGTALDKQLKPFEKRWQTKAGARLLAAGRAYASAAGAKNQAAIRRVLADYPGTSYALAAQAWLGAKDKKKKDPWSYFLGVDRYLNRFEYQNR